MWNRFVLYIVFIGKHAQAHFRELSMDAAFVGNALILNEAMSSCATGQCDRLVSHLQNNLPFENIAEYSCSSLPRQLQFIPNIIILRVPEFGAVKKCIDASKQKWHNAAILVVFCLRPEQPTSTRSELLTLVDDFVFCPFNQAELLARTGRLLELQRSGSKTPAGVHSSQIIGSPGIVGESPAFLSVREKIAVFAGLGTTILISGETGSGKEVVARAIHYQGPRHGKPFIPVNCGALPDHLFENELFGHAKGAFTDASSAEKGLIGEAEGGTLFLDEIDALSLACQVKLLRFLQNGEYRPIGSSRAIMGDVRVIAATNADLLEGVKSKAFREDLYYRLNSLSLRVPPLRERDGDLVLLVNYFLNRYAMEHGQNAREISHAALRQLMAYSWPGNVRELEGVITRALVFSLSETFQAGDIELPASDQGEPTAQFLREAKIKTIEDFERRYLASLLMQHQGNVTHAAKAAGKERRSFQRLLRKHHLDRQSFVSEPR